jgi:hypothetical protein
MSFTHDEAVTLADDHQWWTDRMNIHFLLEYLNGPENETLVLLDVDTALHIVEKPYNYTEEFVLAVEGYAEEAEGGDTQKVLHGLLGLPNPDTEISDDIDSLKQQILEQQGNER